MANILEKNCIDPWFPFGKNWLIFFAVILLSFCNLQCENHTEYESVIIETSETNFSWTEYSHQEVVFSPVEAETLASVPEDQLPLVYWVQTKPKLHYWPTRTIPVVLGPNFDYSESQTIWTALGQLSQTLHKCIVFATRRGDEVDYLYFKKSNSCGTKIGYQGGRHVITLSSGCLDPEEPGAVQHEVLHALGFYHEHSRKDRDNFVEINWQNVRQRDKRDFKKLKFHTFDLPYDYTSVMHYASDAYAIDEAIPTLKPKKPVVNITTMGQRIGLSPVDIRRTRIPYKCDMSDISYQASYGRSAYQKALDEEAEFERPQEQFS